MRKTIKMFLGLLALCLFLVAIGMTAEASITVGDAGRYITVSGETDITLDDIWADGSVDDTKLWNNSGVWLLNYTLNLTGETTLYINPTDGATGCTWLKLNSSNTSGLLDASILVHEQAQVWFNDTMITAWNTTNDANETNGSKFRPYIYIYSDGTEAVQPHCSFTNCTIGYLGYEYATRYGIYYDDGDPGYYPTGWMHNSTVMENWIGIDIVDTQDFNVTNTWFNHSYEAGVVYTGTSHGGYIGDHPSWTHRASYTGVAVDYHHADCDLDNHGIRLNQVDNMTLHIVDVQDAYTDGIWVQQGCVNHTWDNVTVYGCTNSADDYQIYLDNVDESEFTDCTAYSPDGAADGGNWEIGATSECSYNNFTRCIAYGATDQEDFYIKTASYLWFHNCTMNNSAKGAHLDIVNNITFNDCIFHNHTTSAVEIDGAKYNTINRGYINDTATGIKMYDDSDADISMYNTISNTNINNCTTLGIQIGISAGAVDDLCHNNTVTNVAIEGNTGGGHGIALYDNCSYNDINNCTVGNSTGGSADGIILQRYCHHNEITDCTVTNMVDSGIQLEWYCHHNWINSSTSTASTIGISLNGYGAHNNSITSCTSNSNDWGLWSWANTGNNQRDNTFTSCTFNSNTQTGVDIGRCVDLNLVSCTVTGNGVDGIQIRQSGNLDSTYTYPYNQTTGYDWVVEDTATLDYTGRYVLDGAVNDVTNVIDGTFDENTVTHSSGDGYWNATTLNLYASISSSLPSNLVISSWTPTSLYRWSLQATAGTMYAKVGNLAPDTSYHKYVGSNDEGTYRSSSDTMLYPTNTAWFNYSGGWSTKLFSLTTTLSGVSDNGGAGTTTGTNTITIQVVGDGTSITGATVYIYDSIGALVATGTTDSTGTYTTALSDGNYVLKANADGYSLTEQTLTVNGATSALITLISGLNIWLILIIIIIFAVIGLLLYYFRDQIF